MQWNEFILGICASLRKIIDKYPFLCDVFLGYVLSMELISVVQLTNSKPEIYDSFKNSLVFLFHANFW